MERMFRSVGLGSRVGLGGTTPSGWRRAQSGCRSLNCLQADGNSGRAEELTRGGGRVQLPCYCWDKRGRDTGCALGFC